MKEYLFYTTEGYTEGPYPDYPMENCQVLGRVSGNNPEEALNKLIEGNNWICQAGFSEEAILFVQIVTPGMKHDVKEVIQYLWKDEEKHFAENGKPSDHIFKSLQSLKKSL